MNEIHARWLAKAYELTLTQELYMQCSNIVEQRKFVKELTAEHVTRQTADPLGVPNITILGLFRDGRQWICFKRVDTTPLTAYLKDTTTEKTVKVSLEQRDERYRRLTLMKNDGISLKRAKELEEVPLTPTEERIWKHQI